MTSNDPVHARRARIARLAATGRRLGYGLIALAVAMFAGGLVAGFSPFVTTVVSTALAGSALLLPPSLVLGYSVRAAEREDRQSQS